MTLRKAVVIFFIVYGLIGLYTFGPKLFGEKPKQETTTATNEEVKPELEWDVANELNGNFRTPIWLRDPRYKGFVEEVEYTDPVLGEPEFTSAYQLMSLFAQLQLGDPTIASSFVNPYLSHSDYDSKKVADIAAQAEALANRITINRSIIKVKISPPIQEQNNEVRHNVILLLKNGKDIEIRDIPMVMVREEHEQAEDRDNHLDKGMWYMNFNLQELAQRVERTE